MLSGRMVPSSVSCFAILTWGDQGPAHLGAAAGGNQPSGTLSPGQRWCLAVLLPLLWVTLPYSCLWPGASWRAPDLGRRQADAAPH